MLTQLLFGKGKGEASSSGLCLEKKLVWPCKDTQAGGGEGNVLIALKPPQTLRCFSRSSGPALRWFGADRVCAGVPGSPGQSVPFERRLGPQHAIAGDAEGPGHRQERFMEQEQNCKLSWAVAKPFSWQMPDISV